MGQPSNRKALPPPATSIERLFDQPPPSEPEAEAALLGSIILDASVLPSVREHVIDSTFFYAQRNGIIFESMEAVYEKTGSVDLVQIVSDLRSRDLFEDAGGHAYLVELAEAVPSSAAAVHYAKLVATAARKRNVIDQCGTLLHRVYHSPRLDLESFAPLVQESTESMRLCVRASSNGHISLSQTAQEVLTSPPEVVPTGYRSLDGMLGGGGFAKAEFSIIAARPSMGKSALSLNLARRIASSGRRVSYFSMEMGRRVVAARLISEMKKIPLTRITRAELDTAQLREASEAIDELDTLPLDVDDTGGMTMAELSTRARKAVEGGAEIVMVDYLGQIASEFPDQNLNQQVTLTSRQLKALAKELDIALVVMCQLNREVASRRDHRPVMSDLRDSGSLEQDADLICLLHREAYYHQGDTNWELENERKLGDAELIVAKQRNGPTGVVTLTWAPVWQTFSERTGWSGTTSSS